MQTVSMGIYRIAPPRASSAAAGPYITTDIEAPRPGGTVRQDRIRYIPGAALGARYCHLVHHVLDPVHVADDPQDLVEHVHRLDLAP